MPEPSESFDYTEALATFDAALCEALAISQGCAERLPPAYISYGTFVFARLCAHGTAMMRAVPRSRWAKADFEDWNFCVAAPHARAILEGAMFFTYLTEPPSSEDEWLARVYMMQLNDCTRRLGLMENLKQSDEVKHFATEQEKLRQHLRGNTYFQTLPEKAQRECLKGEKPWLKTRDQLVEKTGLTSSQYAALWLLLSQHSHILPLSFYRMETNGRGTGLENETDRQYIAAAMVLTADQLKLATDRMVFLFPDLADLRRGADSKFMPGPAANAPATKDTPTSLDQVPPGVQASKLARALHSYVRVMKRLGE